MQRPRTTRDQKRSAQELQVLSGRVQRAAMTMPPGATVYLANVLAIMSGLRLPWHRRRLTREAKRDLQLLADVLEAGGQALAPRWYKKRVPIYIDNSSFQLSFKKGRSRSADLNKVLRELFWISCKYNCLFDPRWISTHQNGLADALSRHQLQRFFAAAEHKRFARSSQ